MVEEMVETMSNPTTEEDLALSALKQLEAAAESAGAPTLHINRQMLRQLLEPIRSRLTSGASDDAWAVAVLDAWAGIEEGRNAAPIKLDGEWCIRFRTPTSHDCDDVEDFVIVGPTPAAARLAAARALVAQDPSLAEPAKPLPSAREWKCKCGVVNVNPKCCGYCDTPRQGPSAEATVRRYCACSSPGCDLCHPSAEGTK
jgi:hypothetical protein